MGKTKRSDQIFVPPSLRIINSADDQSNSWLPYTKLFEKVSNQYIFFKPNTYGKNYIEYSSFLISFFRQMRTLNPKGF